MKKNRIMTFPISITASSSEAYQLFPSDPNPNSRPPSPHIPPQQSLLFHLNPSRDGLYKLFETSHPTNPNPLPEPSSSSESGKSTRETIPLHLGPSRDGLYKLFDTPSPTNPNPLLAPSPSNEPPCQRRPLFMRCTDGRYYLQIPLRSPFTTRDPSYKKVTTSYTHLPSSLPPHLSPGIPLNVCLVALETSACALRATRSPSPFPQPPAKPPLKRSYSCHF